MWVLYASRDMERVNNVLSAGYSSLIDGLYKGEAR